MNRKHLKRTVILLLAAALLTLCACAGEGVSDGIAAGEWIADAKDGLSYISGYATGYAMPDQVQTVCEITCLSDPQLGDTVVFRMANADGLIVNDTDAERLYYMLFCQGDTEIDDVEDVYVGVQYAGSDSVFFFEGEEGGYAADRVVEAFGEGELMCFIIGPSDDMNTAYFFSLDTAGFEEARNSVQ